MKSARQAQQLEPQNADVHQALARALWMGKGQVEDAIAELRRGITLNPDAGYSWLQLSFLSAIAGELDEAERAARQAIELQERALSGTEGLLIVGAHTRLGYVYYRRGQYDRALEEYRRELAFLSTTDHGLRERTLIELHQKLNAVFDAQGDAEQAQRFGQLAIEEQERRLAAGATAK